MKELILRCCHLLGIMRLFSLLNRRKIVILMLHTVMEDDGKQRYTPLRDTLLPQTLTAYLDILSRYYHFVTLSQAVDMLAGRAPLVPNSMVFTFDDGYRNNLTHAYPLMKRAGAPFIVYLASGLIEKRIPMWVDRLDYAVLHYQGSELSRALSNTLVSVSGGSREQKAASFARFRHAIKSVDCDENEFHTFVDSFAKTLEESCGRSLSECWNDDDWSVLMTWNEALRADREIVSFGGHTSNHIRLTRATTAQVRKELVEGRTELAERLHLENPHFAYPDGNYNEEVSRLVKECGYRSAVTCEEGFNRVGDDLFTLKRISVPLRTTPLDLLARASGLLNLLSSVKKMLTIG